MRHYAPALLGAFLTITNATMWAPIAKSEQTPSRYFSADDVFESVYEIMHEHDPVKYPKL